MADNAKDKAAVAAPTASAEEVQELRKAQETEYGTYVAVAPISFNGSPAYLPGDPVPVTNVERHGYLDQGLVAKVTSAEGKRLITAVHEANANIGSTTAEVAPPVSLSVHVPE